MDIRKENLRFGVDSSWFAIHVRARYEVSVSAHLRAKGYEMFLPLYRSRRIWSDRVKEIEQPLFPGYVFCRFDPWARLPILVIPGVIGVVGVGKTPVPISDVEIGGIKTVIHSGLPSQPCPLLHIGEKVRIETGPLQGLEGILQDFKGRHRLVLTVTLLQRSVAVEIETGCVKSEQEQRDTRTVRFSPVPA